MSARSPKKVYELATELGIGAVDLVEKIRQLGINVRNHMQGLTSEEVEKILEQYPALSKRGPVQKEVVTRRKLKDGSGIVEKHRPVPLRSPVLMASIGAANPEVAKKFAEEQAQKKLQTERKLLENLLSKGLQATFAVHPHGLEAKAQHLGVPLSDDFLHAAWLLEGKSHLPQREHQINVQIENFSDKRKAQLHSQIQKFVDPKWHEDYRALTAQQQGVSAEIAFEAYLQDRKLDFVDLNHPPDFEQQDFSVRGVNVDVKSRRRVSSWIDQSLAAEYTSESEVIAFYTCRSEPYMGGFDCELLGIYDPTSLHEFGRYETKKPPFFNPCFFLNADDYFKIPDRTVYPAINSEALRYVLASRETGVAQGAQLYGPSQMLSYLRTHEKHEGLQEIYQRLQSFNDRGLPHFGPLVVFDWMLTKILAQESLPSRAELQHRVFPVARLNSHQRDYLGLLQWVGEALPGMTCMSSGRPLAAGRLSYGDGYMSSEVGGFRNTLMAFSRVDARILTVKNDERCSCGCLLHEIPWAPKKSGKSGCPHYGLPKS